MRLMLLENWVRYCRPLLGRYMDGDTFSLDVDLAFYLRHSLWVDPDGKHKDPRLRLAGIKAPERYEVGGPEATEFMRQWLTEACDAGYEWPLSMQTIKIDAFGRYIAWVWRVSDGRCLNDDLLEAGHAEVA